MLVKPVIAPELESASVQALDALIAQVKKTGEFDEALLQALQQSLNSMVREMFPAVLGEANASGCSTLEEYDSLQPTRVACLSMLIGRRLESGILDTANLGMSALLMNLGQALNSEEFEVSWASPPPPGESPVSDDPAGDGEDHQHPNQSAELLMKTKRFDPETLESILHHHERWDGSRFPSGLTREQISPFARIIAIADTFYELVSARPDRPAYMPREAVEYISPIPAAAASLPSGVPEHLLC